jgi:trk system potassium uptake protein TrkH
VSSLSTVGLSAGITSPDAPTAVLWTEIVAMILGRLEFFTVIVGSLRLVRDVLALLSRS